VRADNVFSIAARFFCLMASIGIRSNAGPLLVPSLAGTYARVSVAGCGDKGISGIRKKGRRSNFRQADFLPITFFQLPITFFQSGAPPIGVMVRCLDWFAPRGRGDHAMTWRVEEFHNDESV
jgi:hypothetical protein